MKKFKFLCILLLVVFFVSITMDFISDLFLGTRMGYNVTEYSTKQNIKNRCFLYIDIINENHEALMPKIVNNVSNDSIALIQNNVSIIEYSNTLYNDENVETLDSLLNIFNWLILVIYIYLIVVFVKIMRLFIKSQVFEGRIISLLNHSGIAFLILFLISTIWNVGRTMLADKLIEIENITISYRHCFEWNTLLMGLVILIITEIFRQATNIKKEQDLTI